MSLAPNQRDVAATTAGIARNMQAPGVIGLGVTVTPTGGGDMNGSAATSILLHQAGTAGAQVSVPRRPPNSNNYCGVV